MSRRRNHAAAEIHGRRAEFLAALLLRLKFYRIVARHWKSGLGELDIVARRGRYLAVVEVKARDRLSDAAEALSRNQRARIARAARLFLHQHPAHRDCQLRFDLMLVLPWRLPIHLTNAWHDET
jgi:putative endonuclease